MHCYAYGALGRSRSRETAGRGRILHTWEMVSTTEQSTQGLCFPCQRDECPQLGYDEQNTPSSPTSTDAYLYDGEGQRVEQQVVSGVVSYLGSDGLGSAEVALDSSGGVQASVRYTPYGAARYSSGSMPGSDGCTGQRSDVATGLDDYTARGTMIGCRGSSPAPTRWPTG